ncbi:MAG: class I tRNA ligase family protein, partial [Verrucomicrobiota bacterium]
MYCDAADSPRRLATQTAMHTVFDSMARLLAPILVYTADEAWEYAGNDKSIHLESFPEPNPDFDGTDAIDEVQQLLRIRDAAQARIDESIKAGDFKKRERAAVEIGLKAKDPARQLLEESREDSLEFLMLSDYSLTDGDSDEPVVTVRETEHPECPRCRRSLPLAKDGLCLRCYEVLK